MLRILSSMLLTRRQSHALVVSVARAAEEILARGKAQVVIQLRKSGEKRGKARGAFRRELRIASEGRRERKHQRAQTRGVFITRCQRHDSNQGMNHKFRVRSLKNLYTVGLLTARRSSPSP